MNAVVEREKNPLVVFGEQMDKRVEQFKAALPAHIPVERFKRVVLTAVQMNTDLIYADRQTFWNSCMKAAQDGLLPDGRESALVIYNTKIVVNGSEKWIEAVQYIAMIAGLRKKVRNSGEIATWDTSVVYQKDEFDYAKGDTPYIKHKPYMGDGDPGPVVAAYSIAALKSGEKAYEVMTRSQIEKVRARSKAKKGGPWFSDYEEMCRKTVARRHSKVLPMSTDLDDLIRRDDALYDLEGASDKIVAPERPQLADFSSIQPNEPMDENPKHSAPSDAERGAGEGTVSSGLSPSPANQSAAGSLDAGSTAAQEPGDSAAETTAEDAHALGRKARDDNKALRAVPPEWRGQPAGSDEAVFADAWADGWKERDDEIAKEGKGKS